MPTQKTMKSDETQDSLALKKPRKNSSSLMGWRDSLLMTADHRYSRESGDPREDVSRLAST